MTNQELDEYIEKRMGVLRNQGSNLRYRWLDHDSRKEAPSKLLAHMVGDYARAIFDKVLCARDKYGFNELGWATPDWQEELQKGIASHLQKGDPRDVAVYAMFAWFHGWSTATPPPPAAAGTVDAGLLADGFLRYLYEWLEDEAAKKLTEEVAHEWRANEMNGQLDDTFDAGEAHGRGELAATLRTAIAAELLKEAAAQPPQPQQVPAGLAGGAWVPVGERLPDNLDDHLVLVRPIGEALQHTNDGAAYYKITHLNFAKTGFYVEYTEDGQHPTEEVTHWQPLPTPPADAPR